MKKLDNASIFYYSKQLIKKIQIDYKESDIKEQEIKKERLKKNI